MRDWMYFICCNSELVEFQKSAADVSRQKQLSAAGGVKRLLGRACTRSMSLTVFWRWVALRTCLSGFCYCHCMLDYDLNPAFCPKLFFCRTVICTNNRTLQSVIILRNVSLLECLLSERLRKINVDLKVIVSTVDG